MPPLPRRAKVPPERSGAFDVREDDSSRDAPVASDRVSERLAVGIEDHGIVEQLPRVPHVRVDQGYTGSGRAWIEEHLGWTVEVVRHPPNPRGS
jgi:hypothetical protein